MSLLTESKMEELKQIYKIAKFRFDTKEEYLAGERDVKKIAELDVKKSMNYADVSAIARKIQDEGIVFESKIGEAFLDSLNHRLHTYHRLVVRRLLAVLCYAVIAGCMTFFLVAGVLEYRSQKTLEELRSRIESEEAFNSRYEEIKQRNEVSINWLPQNTEDWFPETSGQTVHFLKEPIDEQSILPKYVDVYKENNDFAGWLRIMDTGIDYPVMYGPDNSYYLSRNMDGKYDKNGMLIMDVGCRISSHSPQFIIYGHNVQSGRMFGELLNYKDKAYWKFHPMIQFDLLTEEAEYEIVSVFLVSLDEEDELAEFYLQKEFEDENKFAEYIEMIKENSLYDTEVLPAYGEPLLTLVTCDNSVKNGRFVVVAGKID